MGLQVGGFQVETECNGAHDIRDLQVFKDRRDLKVPKAPRDLRGLRVPKDLKVFKEMWGMLGQFCTFNIY
jgi:hypothetical protein